MRKSIRSVLSAFLALCLIFGMPMTALADTSSTSCGNKDDAIVLVDESIEYCDLANNIVSLIDSVINQNSMAQKMFKGSKSSDFVKKTAINMIKDELGAAQETIDKLGFDLNRDKDKLSDEVYVVACIHYDELNYNGGTAESARKLAILELIRFTLVEVQGYTNEKAVETANFYYEVNAIVAANGKDAAVNHVMSTLAGPHVFGEPTWTWSADNATASALFKCTNPKCSYTQTVNGAVTSKTTDATCETGSSTTYTATATLDSKTATNTKTVNGNALGHAYGDTTWTWATDYSKATASATCTRSGCGKTASVDAEITVDSKSVTCDEGGNIIYTATAKIGDKDVTSTQTVAVAPGHHPMKVDAVAATCETNGVKEHYKCYCGKLFADAEAKTEVTAEALVIKAGHSLKKVEAVAATCDKDGMEEHYICSCSKIFADAEAKTEITADSLVIEKTSHNYQDGVCTICGDTEDTTGDIYRIYGSNRYQTAFEAADILKDILDLDRFEAVVVAGGADFADALSGSYLATSKNAPILLINARNEAAVLEYIAENLEADGTVYILGGELAVAKSFEKGLSKSYTVKRLEGASRYTTNLKVLQEVGVAGKEILVCTGTDYADSLSASALGLPILLVKNKLFDYQIEFLSQLKDATFRVVGGESVVSTELSAQLAQYGKVSRTGGSNRYQTSVLLANQYHSKADTAVLAYGRNFPDGLCGGPLAYALNAPMILTQDGKELVASAYTSFAGINGGYVLGGDTLVSDTTAQKILTPDASATGGEILDKVNPEDILNNIDPDQILGDSTVEDVLGDSNLDEILGDANLGEVLGDANLEDILGSLIK